MILLGLLACLPAEFTVQGDVFDIAGECWDTNVTVTLKTKYWRELLDPPNERYTQDSGCPGDEAFPTADGRCLVIPSPCVDRPPTIEHDPALSFDHDAVVACVDAYNGDYPWAPCPAPALTAWP